ncbi:hypothetical protein TBLA_0B07240 [Henningerozyma blattae CBS 6284]|uniref:N(6)-L-threonylcarbamoyladenine synthase n=1 Tax=Henningerozyma blattae (strain ATCC 34711 / CBS 6284 / DSM 70876 / NBRC 10599 / NRRL Y-10934 / UCD 77-7) TaxID=1071380 RepID=I2GZJ0_HENB6|nr:hypothetical protein TBLA_0B07240 [Tetrapisispora blattae CBS 6284]CCH59542.1 hypothetical protein TBLA_0B07240 [Tetrapisispora blattae CBS 6284]
MKNTGLSLVKRILCYRSYNVLAIETSCDDTCVALLNRNKQTASTQIIAQERITLDSVADGGIIPTKAHTHHQKYLADMVNLILQKIPLDNKLDLVCATRGPGMPGSLAVGLDFAKGLAVGRGVPLVGVHHMLGHLLVSRLKNESSLNFPFATLLVSGGHTQLVVSKSVEEHKVICNTLDIAAGDALDKCARELGLKGNMLAQEMEQLARLQPGNSQRSDEDFQFPNPLLTWDKKLDGFSFSPFVSVLKKQLDAVGPCDINITSQAAKKVQLAVFNHIITRMKRSIINHKQDLENINQLVCAGGVACNQTLRTMLANELNATFKEFIFPEPALCRDNAVMIGWAGIELYESLNLKSSLNILPQRKWSLEDLLALDGWNKN